MKSATTDSGAAAPPRRSKNQRKAFWTKQFILWHWVSSAICLFAMLGFAFTGITLNHAADIPATPEVVERSLTLSEAERALLAPAAHEPSSWEAPLPDELARSLGRELHVPLKGRQAEWTAYELYLSMPRPGGDAWLAIDRDSGEVEFEDTNRGAISYLNDLHKGRDTGTVWSWFIDVFGVACFVFCLTGLGLLWAHAKRRPRTWPLVIGGILLPVVILLIFVH